MDDAFDQGMTIYHGIVRQGLLFVPPGHLVFEHTLNKHAFGAQMPIIPSTMSSLRDMLECHAYSEARRPGVSCPKTLAALDMYTRVMQALRDAVGNVDGVNVQSIENGVPLLALENGDEVSERRGI